MKSKAYKFKECGDNMIWGSCKRQGQSEMILSKSYNNVLPYESVKLMKRPVSVNSLMKVLRLTHLILMLKWEVIYWDTMSSYKKPTSMMYEHYPMNEMKWNTYEWMK